MIAPRIKLAALAIAAALLVGGCSLQDTGDPEDGRQLFIENCGTCHYLAEAATTADVGPDLDASFAAARNVGMNDETIEGIVLSQIANPRETRSEDDPTYMPADIVTGEDAEDVAAYVGEVAGVPGIEPPEAPGGPGGQVFANNGCGACHTMAAAESTGTTGPNLDDVIPGQSPAMIEESIVDPEAEVTQGFDGGIMPSDYGDSIPPEDLELLVEFLAEESGQEPGGEN